MSDEQPQLTSGLRSRAEAALASGRRPRREYAQLQDRERLLRELTVHQLEVELQNEDLRAAQRALLEEQRQLRAILDAAIEGIVTFDRAGTIATSNRAAEDLFGAALVGRNVADLVAPEDRGTLSEWLSGYGTQERGGPARRELTGIRSDDEPFPMEVGLGLAHHGDARVTAVIRDLSERTQLQERFLQAQKMEAVGRLASGVAHDFNNLLMGISGSADVALSRLLADHPARPVVEEIKREALGGAGIVRQLLAFGRRPVEERQRCTIDPALARSEGMVTRLLGEDVRVQMALRAGTVAVPLPPSQVQQILMNLVANARDAMSEGGVLSIATGVELATDAARWVRLTVADTGKGMDAQTRDLIFEPFFTTKGTTQGTGLGLWTVFSLVRQAGGHIEVDSEPGTGTTFCVLLPVTDQAMAAPAIDRVPLGQGEVVLVVEDEPLVRQAIHHYLTGGGYEVIDAATCAEARAVLEGGAHVDLVLSDVVLPDGYGPELTRELPSDGPPVLLMSAHPSEMLIRAGRLPAGQAALQKPCTRDQLLRSLHEALEAAAPSDPAPEGAEPACILVVEDHDAARCAMVQLLDAEGYRVIAACSGAEALAAAAATQVIDIVVSDVELPDASGDTLVDRLRAEHPGAPVLFVSGLDPGDERVARATARSRTRFLQKPIELERLIAIVRTTLEALPAKDHR